jgi:hypothetical protein
MPDPVGAKKLYFKRDLVKVVEKFTAEDIAVLLDEGKGLFELTMSDATPAEMEYIQAHPKLMEVIKKW